MKSKIIALVLVVTGFLVASYLVWTFHRTTGVVFVSDHQWPRSLPYPDYWILCWNHELDLAHPAAWGTMKIRGELPRIQLYLSGYILLALLVMSVGLVWLKVLKKEKVGFENEKNCSDVV